MTLLEPLVQLLGAKHVRAMDDGPAGAPTVVASPEDVEQIQGLLAWARSAGTTVVPMGSGRHFEHRMWPESVVFLSTERLSGVQIYESADLTLTAGAGTPLADLTAPLAEASQWLPFDPPDATARTLGGLIGAGRTGPVWAGYGALRNHVLGATVVCGDGRVLRLGGRVVKNVAGFDLLRPMVGSRGALATIVSATVRLFPMPVVDRFLAFEAPNLEAATAVLRALATGPVRSTSAVLVGDSASVRLLLRLQGAALTVAADRSALETHAGVSFAELSDAEATRMHSEIRDAAWSEESVLQAVRLPGDLGELLRGVSELPNASFVADGHEGSVRVAFDGSDPGAEIAISALREQAASDGGSLRWLRGPWGAEAPLTGGPSAAVRELEKGVKSLFDPTGVYPDLPR